MENRRKRSWKTHWKGAVKSCKTSFSVLYAPSI